MKISVIIPIYNMGEYLEECLDSVVRQTLIEIEIICINDGSTDHSLSILKKYEKKYDNIVIVDQKNMGVAAARNKGLDIAKGEYVNFMDPDDYYPDSRVLEDLYRLAGEHNVMVCGGSRVKVIDGELITRFEGAHLIFTENKIYDFRDYQSQYGFTRFIFSLKMLRENAVYFPLYIRYEDPPFFVKAMLCAGKFYGFSRVSTVHRVGHKRLVLNERIVTDVMKGLLDLLLISKEHNLAILHARVVKNINIDYYSFFAKGIVTKSKMSMELIKKINHEMDEELLGIAESPYLNAPQFDYQKVIKKTNDMKNRHLSEMKQFEKIIIYGAGNIGKSMINYLSKETDINIAGIAVTNRDNNLSIINGVSVDQIDDLAVNYDNTLFVVAVMSHLQNAILDELKKRNIEHYLLLTQADIELIELYYE